MEVPAMEETKSDVHLTSAAAFVEGGIQEACDDSCSICLEAFCDSDPSTVTSCKHEFHLQFFLQGDFPNHLTSDDYCAFCLLVVKLSCQRSSQCPMCWQSISLKDPTSQELLEAVEKERSLRLNPSRNATIFHHPALGEFELQHLPVGVSDAELEERIIQHLAAAAAMGRARHIARREGHRNRSSAQSRPQFLVFSPHPNSPPAVPVSSLPAQNEDVELTAAVNEATLSPRPTSVGEESPLASAAPPAPPNRVSASGSGSVVLSANQQGTLLRTGSPSPSSPVSQDRAGPSEFPSFSESLKCRLNAMSTKYKESISKSTRGWKERWFSRNTSMSELGSEVRREVNAGIATVSRMMERLETRDNRRTNETSLSTGIEDRSTTGSYNQHIPETADGSPLGEGNVPASCATGSRSS